MTTTGEIWVTVDSEEITSMRQNRDPISAVDTAAERPDVIQRVH